MKIQLICENCNTILELAPENYGQEVRLGNMDGVFHTHDVELDYDFNVDDIEDVTAKLDSIRFDCKQCSNYIVLKDFDY